MEGYGHRHYRVQFHHARFPRVGRCYRSAVHTYFTLASHTVRGLEEFDPRASKRSVHLRCLFGCQDTRQQTIRKRQRQGWTISTQTPESATVHLHACGGQSVPGEHYLSGWCPTGLQEVPGRPYGPEGETSSILPREEDLEQYDPTSFYLGTQSRGYQARYAHDFSQSNDKPPPGLHRGHTLSPP